MRSLARWWWHRFWIWEPVCRVTSSTWSNGTISWRCSCKKAFKVKLWPKEGK